MKSLCIVFALLATSVKACPVVEDPQPYKDQMLEKLSAATDFTTARMAEHEVWKIWQTAPDAQSQDWLNEGMARIRQADWDGAKAALKSLTEYCPEYAEGHNQLAFAHFLSESYDASRVSLKRTMELEPRHFGAISGMGLIAHKQGRLAAAKIWIKKAVAIHPFMNERVILDIPDDGDAL